MPGVRECADRGENQKELKSRAFDPKDGSGHRGCRLRGLRSLRVHQDQWGAECKDDCQDSSADAWAARDAARWDDHYEARCQELDHDCRPSALADEQESRAARRAKRRLRAARKQVVNQTGPAAVDANQVALAAVGELWVAQLAEGVQQWVGRASAKMDVVPVAPWAFALVKAHRE